MNSVLFTHSYFYKLDAKQWRFKQPYPPLATILAAAVIRQEGYPVSLFDTNLRNSPAGVTTILQQYNPRYFVIYDDSFNYLSKMCLTTMRDAALQMAQEAKKCGCTIIISSSDATDHYEKYLARGADYVIRGEGEETLKALLATLDKGEAPINIQGIAYKSEHETIVTTSRAIFRDLDALPFPAWDLVDMESYRKVWIKHHGYFSLNIATTRGCPFKCNWCAKPIYGNRYNSRSPQHVVREIQFLLKKYRPDHFWMCDDIFGLKPGWVQEFKNLVESENVKFRYKIQSRADLLLQEDTIEALAKSGLETAWVGAESGSQKILDAMDKGTTITQIRQATRLLKQKNIQVAFFIQFGYLGETQEDIDATIKMILDLMPDDMGISVSYPLPGTKFYEKVKDQLKEKQNWTDSDDLAMMFQNTFNSRYYKELHRYVHSVYRKRKGYNSFKRLLRNPLQSSTKDFKSSLGTFYFAIKSYLLNKRLVKLSHQTSLLGHIETPVG